MVSYDKDLLNGLTVLMMKRAAPFLVVLGTVLMWAAYRYGAESGDRYVFLREGGLVYRCNTHSGLIDLWSIGSTGLNHLDMITGERTNIEVRDKVSAQNPSKN